MNVEQSSITCDIRTETSKQAVWYTELDSYLTSNSAHQSSGDATFYWFSIEGIKVTLLVYDYILVASKDKKAMEHLKSLHIARYEMSDMGPVSLILGIKGFRNDKGIRLH